MSLRDAAEGGAHTVPPSCCPLENKLDIVEKKWKLIKDEVSNVVCSLTPTGVPFVGETLARCALGGDAGRSRRTWSSRVVSFVFEL